MAQPDDGRGTLYEQVLEYAKREMDEAAAKMADMEQSLQLLEARVEAANAVYQAVASRLNLEDEADRSSFEVSLPDLPLQAPEPPPQYVQNPSEMPKPEKALDRMIGVPAATLSVQEETNRSPAQPDKSKSEALSDLDLHRENPAGKTASTEDQALAEPAVAPPVSKPVASADENSFSVQLIRQNMEKSEENTPAVKPADPPQVPAAPIAEPALKPISEGPASPKSEDSGGLSDTDLELIGTYLRSKQN